MKCYTPDIIYHLNLCSLLKCSILFVENSTEENSWENSEENSRENSHVFKTLKDVETQIKSKFSDAIKQLSKKVAELCVEEKQAWLKLDDIEEDCRTLTIQVEKKAEELVSE